MLAFVFFFFFGGGTLESSALSVVVSDVACPAFSLANGSRWK